MGAMAEPLSKELLDQLRELDTPTVCNALEVVAPDRRGYGYSISPFFAPRPHLPPIVGYARTGKMRAQTPPTASVDEQTRTRLAYYEHIGSAPGPTITVIEDHRRASPVTARGGARSTPMSTRAWGRWA